MTTGEHIPLEEGDLRYWPTFLSLLENETLFDALRSSLPWSRHRVKLGARSIPSPRLSSWHGDSGVAYTYSGETYTATGWTSELLALRKKVEIVTTHSFNSVLANLYRDGGDSMGWHADRERELGEAPVIASVSLGAYRKFMLKHRKRNEIPRVELWLKPGSLLLMEPPTQTHWRHALPKTKLPVGPRLNLTFRHVFS